MIVVQSAPERSPDLPDVPSIFEFIDKTANPDEVRQIMVAWDALNAVGRPVAAPPGVPDDRVAFLRQAFHKSMTDPDFVAAAKKGKRDLDYLSGDKMAAVAKASTGMSPKVRKIFVAAIRGEI